MMGGVENNNNSMMSHGANSESGSDSNSPIQYSISPSQPVKITKIFILELKLLFLNFEPINIYYIISITVIIIIVLLLFSQIFQN